MYVKIKTQPGPETFLGVPTTWGLRPMKIRLPESSASTPFKRHAEIHGEVNAMEMKIDAMQMEIQKLKAANVVKHSAQESQIMRTSKWKVLFYAFVGWLMYYMYTSLGKGNRLALP